MGQAVTYTATLHGPSRTLPSSGETVSFYDGGNLIAACDAVELSDTAPYKATCPVIYLSTMGSPHAITATYSGDTSYGASTSAPFSQTVHAAKSATS